MQPTSTGRANCERCDIPPAQLKRRHRRQTRRGVPNGNGAALAGKQRHVIVLVEHGQDWLTLCVGKGQFRLQRRYSAAINERRADEHVVAVPYWRGCGKANCNLSQASEGSVRGHVLTSPVKVAVEFGTA